MAEKKYNYTYIITNRVNNKTYIGVHSTDELKETNSNYKYI